MAATTISTTTIDVAIAAAAEINVPVSGTVWLQTEFTCEQRWLPAHSDSDLTSRIWIDVMPIGEKTNRIARKIVERQHRVELWIQKKVPTDPTSRDEAIADLARFACQVKDYFLEKNRVLATLANVYPMESEIDVTYNPKDLQERSLWVAVIHLAFVERSNQ